MGNEKDVAGGGIMPSSRRWLPWKEEGGSLGRLGIESRVGGSRGAKFLKVPLLPW